MARFMPAAGLLALVLLARVAWGAEQGLEGRGLPPPVRMTAQEDHRRMMEVLGIESLRRGADGFNRQSPHYRRSRRV